MTASGLRELAPGVMQVVGGRSHSLAVEMGEYLIVVEAPEDDRHSRAVLDTLRTRFPTKQVRYVVNTHFHAVQAGGLRAYVAADATVVTAALNVSFFQDVFGALHTQVPDALHRRPRDAVIEAVRDERKFFVDEHRVVIVFPVETVHADGMLLVHLPEERLLFASELFTPGAPQQVAEWCHDLLRAIKAQRLDVETIVGSRGGVGTLAELRRTVRESADDVGIPPAVSAVGAWRLNPTAPDRSARPRRTGSGCRRRWPKPRGPRRPAKCRSARWSFRTDKSLAAGPMPPLPRTIRPRTPKSWPCGRQAGAAGTTVCREQRYTPRSSRV